MKKLYFVVYKVKQLGRFRTRCWLDRQTMIRWLRIHNAYHIYHIGFDSFYIDINDFGNFDSVYE